MVDNLEQRLNTAVEGKLSALERETILSECESVNGCLLRLAAFVLCLTVWLGIIYLMHGLVGSMTFDIIALVSLLLCCVLGIVPSYWYGRRVNHRVSRRLLLLGIRPRVCLSCGYDLKGSVADHCPECGTALAPVDTEVNQSV